MARKKIATIWLGGCSGCHMSLLDMDERILDVAALADIVKSPVVDGKKMPKVDIAIVEGAITSDEHYQEILHIRKQATILIALGDCAIHNNVTGLRNFFNLQDVLNTSYVHAASNDKEGKMPAHPLLLNLHEKVIPVGEAVPVDFFINGCPPDADYIFYVIAEYLHNRMPISGGSKKIQYG